MIAGTKRTRRALCVLVMFATFLSTFAGLVSRSYSEELATNEVAFEQYEVYTKTTGRQTILTGFFLGGAFAEIVVIHIDENSERRLNMLEFDGVGWEPVLEAKLRSGVLFVDVININGRDRLVSYEHGRLNWFDFDTLTEHPLVDVRTNYNATPDGLGYAGSGTTTPADAGEIPYINITRDVNGDGRDDVVLPDLDGFWISTQLNDGAFTDPIKLGPPEPFRDAIAFGDTRKYGDVGISPMTFPWYLSRVYNADFNQDGRSDLVFWNDDHFDVYFQEADGRFAQVATSFAVEVPVDSDAAYSLIFGLADARAFSLITGLRRKSELTVLRSVRDLNNDGFPDLLTHTLQGRSVLRMRSRYDVHFGASSADGIVFAQESGSAIEPRGRAGGIEPGGYSSLWLDDFDGDGQVDILRGDIKIGVGAVIRALLGKSITMTAQLYRMEDGVYPTKATTTRKIVGDIEIRDGRDNGFFPFVLMGDVNGDGRSDFLVGKNREELHIFPGDSGPERFAREVQIVTGTLPGDERNTWLAHINQDKKQDIVMHFPSPEGPHKITILIAQ
jgi:hypothetical protein